MFVGIVVCACSRHALGFKMLIFWIFRVTKGLLRDYFTYEQVKTTVTAWRFHVGADGLWASNASVLFETQT